MRSTSAEFFSVFPAQNIQLRKAGRWMGSWWRWLSIRQIHVESIVLCRNEVRPGFMIPSMRRVQAKRFFLNADLQFLIRNCPALQSLGIEVVAARDENNLFVPIDIDLELLNGFCQSLEEFSYYRFAYLQTDYVNDQEFYRRTAAALVSMLRQCTCLRKVSLTGDSLQAVNLEELHPYGHLFYELEFRTHGRISAYGQPIANLFVRCNNLRELIYYGDNNDQDSLVLTAIHQSCLDLEALQLSLLQKQVLVPSVFTLVSHNCKQLHSLVLFRCELSASTLRSISEMETLKELSLQNCDGLTDAGVARLAVMNLTKLVCKNEHTFHWTAECLSTFVGSNLSQTLVSFELSDNGTTVSIDDAQVAYALASCHQLKTMKAISFGAGCVFGRSGLDGLQAMAIGCPLLADVALELTASGVHYIGAHFTSVKKCWIFKVFNMTVDRPSTPTELQTLYPAIKWEF